MSIEQILTHAVAFLAGGGVFLAWVRKIEGWVTAAEAQMAARIASIEATLGIGVAAHGHPAGPPPPPVVAVAPGEGPQIAGTAPGNVAR